MGEQEARATYFPATAVRVRTRRHPLIYPAAGEKARAEHVADADRELREDMARDDAAARHLGVTP